MNKNPFDPRWRGYKIFWCDICMDWNIKCNSCDGTSCNGGGCEKCGKDFDEFNKLMGDAYDNTFSEEEKKIIQKYERYNYLIKECLENDRNPIDWSWLSDKLSKCDEEIFKKYLK